MENIENEYEYKEIQAFLITHKNDEFKYTNSNEKFEYKVGSEGLVLKLDEPFYLHHIEIEAENLNLDKINISGEDIFIKKIQLFTIEKIDSEFNNHYKITINTVIHELKISYDGGWLNGNKIELKGIRLHGISLFEIEKYLEPLSKIHSYKLEVDTEIASQKKVIKEEEEKAKATLSQINQKISEYTEISNSKKTEIQTLEQKLLKLKTEIPEQEALVTIKTEEITKLETNITAKTKTLQEIESKSRQLNGENEKIAKEIVEQQASLRKLKNESSLYSNEYASFSIQSNKFMLAYGILSLLPMSVMTIIVVNLYNSTLSFIEIISLLTLSKVSDVIILKMPYVLLSSAIITACYYIIKMLILKIMDIQTEKLSLSKISIIAQDTVNLSSTDYNLKPEQILEANIYLRMDLLKNYMTREIDRNYKYALRDQELLDNVMTDSPIKKIFSYFKNPKPVSE